MLPPTPSPSPSPPPATMARSVSITAPSSALSSSSAEDEEMTTALHEALTCTSCAIDRIPKSTFRADTAAGRYDPSLPMPFRSQDREFEIAPDEMFPDSDADGRRNDDKDEMDIENDGVDLHPRLWRSASPTTARTHSAEQRGRYISYAELTPPATPPSGSDSTGHLYEALVARYFVSHDSAADVAFARYRADYHVHVHYMLRRGVLGVCRDGKDVYELKGWKRRLHAVDSGEIALEQLESGMVDWRDGMMGGGGGGGGIGKGGGGGYYASSPYQSYYPAPSPTAALPRTQRAMGGWPDDENQLMVYQVALWRKRGRSRQRRLEDARIKWAFIMEERRRQRLAALAQAQHQKTASSVKVRLYCSQAGGDRNLIREIEMDGRSFGELIR
ncbi:uncharacterized protein BO97DRAFT_442974 [Aspergillus homomorphus CBS 101889]|uniref:Uncharacterized protein n=1 Tax=Aspergillus homomorphus (strain CBS 101889) TaxID=1450537 RepID=A0A395I0S3_ASPHC|nr:hypothetical protein BO97DRAFT_442974 [Aspergillus homomorphus CBS 101889]RAL12748.1 hypothetical protein BO97DRAFT_442974 [Aspergillus homomorphus CBS 101889]